MLKKVYIENGHGLEETALLDTGAGVSIIDYAVARRIGLQYTGRSTTLTAASGDDFEAYETDPVSIYVPEAGCWSRHSLYVSSVPVRANGRVILGADYMRKARIRLEYENGEKVSSGEAFHDSGQDLGHVAVGGLAIVGAAAVGYLIFRFLASLFEGSKG